MVNIGETRQFRVEIKDGYLSLYPGYECPMADAGYNIELSRLRTPGQILGWARHLSGKGWLGEKGIADFVCKAFSLLGIEPDCRL